MMGGLVGVSLLGAIKKRRDCFVTKGGETYLLEVGERGGPRQLEEAVLHLVKKEESRRLERRTRDREQTSSRGERGFSPGGG